MTEPPFKPEDLCVITEYECEINSYHVRTSYDPGPGYNILWVKQSVDHYKNNPDKAYHMLVDAFNRGQHLK